MSRRLLACSSWALSLGLGCAPSPEAAQVPSISVALPEPPEPPAHGLPVVPLGEDWAPGRAIAGDLQGLRDALRDARAVRAKIEPRLMTPGQDGPVRDALQQLRPDATWTLEALAWADAVVGVPSLQRLEADVGAAPRYPTHGMSPRGSVGETTVVIGEAPVDLTAWRALPAASAGSCEPVFEALALGQEQSLAYVEPFLDHADTVLRLRFRAGLAQVLPELRAQVEPYASPEPRADATPDEAEAHACGHALYARVEEAARCSADRVCPTAPRMVLRGGAAVAMPAPPWSPGDCGARVPLRVEETLQSIATEASVATVSQLEPRWVTLVDRVGAIGAVYEALDDVCSPRRRRFAAEDLADARARLERVERALGSDVLDESGRWDVGVGSLFVPGAGPMITLATFRAAEAGASQTAIAGAKGVRRFLLSRSLCRSGYGELPLAVAVFEPGASTPSFAGYLYEETLVCADLPLP